MPTAASEAFMSWMARGPTATTSDAACVRSETAQRSPIRQRQWRSTRRPRNRWTKPPASQWSCGAQKVSSRQPTSNTSPTASRTIGRRPQGSPGPGGGAADSSASTGNGDARRCGPSAPARQAINRSDQEYSIADIGYAAEHMPEASLVLPHRRIRYLLHRGRRPAYGSPFGNFEEALVVTGALPGKLDATILQRVDCLVALGRRAEAIVLLQMTANQLVIGRCKWMRPADIRISSRHCSGTIASLRGWSRPANPSGRSCWLSADNPAVAPGPSWRSRSRRKRSSNTSTLTTYA